MGQCAKRHCHSNSFSTNDTCQEKETYCCSGSAYTRIDIPCDNFNYTLNKVTQCGCSKCVDPKVTIRGVVVTADRNFPVENATIYHNKSVVTQSNSNGQFVMVLPITSRRIAITATASGKSSLHYGDGTSVLSLNANPEGVYHVTIKLPRAKTLPSFDGTRDGLIKIKTEKGELADVKLTPGGYRDIDGMEYKVSRSFNAVMFSLHINF